MNLYYDDQYVGNITILPEYTLKQIKDMLRDWLSKNGINNYTTRIVLNDKTELNQIVFDTNQYDDVTFETYRNTLTGGYIIINSIKNPIVVPAVPVVPVVPHIVNIKGDKTQRKKVHTTQIQKQAEPKTKAARGMKPNKKEIEYIRNKRLQALNQPNQTETGNILEVPKRLQPISEEEKARRTYNLTDAALPQTLPIISDIQLPACVPNKGNYNLHDYQLYVVNHMLNHRGLIVDHSVGSGKTLIAATSSICVLNAFPYIKVVFIGPKSLLSNFKLTLEKAFHNVDWGRIFMYTYEKFHHDYKNGLIDGYNSYLIVDEAHRLRTHADSKFNIPSLTVSSVMKFARKANKVLLLTATPVVNEPYDIMNLIAIIRGDLRPMPKKTFHKTIYSKKGVLINRNIFNNTFICTISIFIRPQDETYPRVETHTVKIPMNQIYYNEYKRVEDQTITDHQREVLGPNDLEPFYNGIRRTVNADIEEYNPKLDWIRNHLLTYNNRKMVIFSPFISLGVKQLEQVVQDFTVKPIIGHIIGSDTKIQRQQTIDDFNNDKIQVLLISVGAGGLGISLRGTRDVVIMQPGWNDVEMEQSIGRAVRFHSHTHLPIEEQKVDVWKLIMVKPAGVGGVPAADEIILGINDRKNAIINPFLRLLETVTIERIPC
jgi:SNF2 family DNA or RNA helicase